MWDVQITPESNRFGPTATYGTWIIGVFQTFERGIGIPLQHSVDSVQVIFIYIFLIYIVIFITNKNKKSRQFMFSYW